MKIIEKLVYIFVASYTIYLNLSGVINYSLLAVLSLIVCIRLMIQARNIVRISMIKDGSNVTYKRKHVERKGTIRRSGWFGFSITEEGNPTPYYFKMNKIKYVEYV